MPESAAEVCGLSRAFGADQALDDVSLEVAVGSVFGLVGQNGAGKSTLIKHLLGLWRAQSGAVRVFGLDPVAEPQAVLRRIGYLSENPELPAWMRVSELLLYLEPLYPTWDRGYANRLRDQFDLDPSARIGNLSKGQQAKLGLLTAQSHRPDLLLLDEPSSGLDPVVRTEILEAIIHTVSEEGRTVLFSSHLLDEVERVSDHLALLERGRLQFCGVAGRHPGSLPLGLRALRQPAAGVPCRFRRARRGRFAQVLDRCSGHPHAGLAGPRCDACGRGHRGHIGVA